MEKRARRLGFSVLLCLFSLPSVVQAAKQIRYAVWSEFLPYEIILKDRVLEKLASVNSELYLAVKEPELRRPIEFTQLKSILREAKRLGVSVRLWPLLSTQDGYWANRWTIDKLRIFVEELVSRLDSEGLKPEWIVLDMEPHFTLFQKLGELIDQGETVEALRLLRSWNQKHVFGESFEKFHEFIASMHAKGLKVHGVAIPQILDDIRNGHRRVQSAFGTPFDGLDWDEVSFMVYRPIYESKFANVSDDFVYSYARDIALIYGERGGVDIGPIGSKGFGIPKNFYRTPEGVMRDVSAALAAGVKKVNLFSLEGIIEQKFSEEWFSQPVPEVPVILAAHVFRFAIQFRSHFLPFGFDGNIASDKKTRRQLLERALTGCDQELAGKLKNEGQSSRKSWFMAQFQRDQWLERANRLEKSIKDLERGAGLFDRDWWNMHDLADGARRLASTCQETMNLLPAAP